MHVLVIVGTRPEGIKMAPVINELKRRNDIKTTVVSTGQHREMLQSIFNDFGIYPDIDLDIMQPNQTLSSLTGKLFDKIDIVLREKQPDWVLVQGDTTSVQVGALCAFYHGIKVGHIEAGLRSYDMSAPFPEELNRRVAGLVATKHFAPTIESKNNLLREGIDEGCVHVTGNTGIDALLHMADIVNNKPPEINTKISNFTNKFSKYVLITGHRRENFGEGFENICFAIKELSIRWPEVGFLYPVHLNPNVQEPVKRIIGDRDNVLLTEPQDYRCFIYLMSNSRLILSDSGGIQEEAPSLKKPILVMRDVTERPEGVAAGCAELVGTSIKKIVSRASALLENVDEYALFATSQNPYGDGQASARIASSLYQ
ncbi:MULTISPECIES: non-hydrolyzing UDP-N-acetylglucosamine 2-epimerase [unclassified Pseudovibrio]|uniref:non-hydrolyzing UDP-N-acetylglucosamine 2-epimerase n=1 Tax=unclassified Pseudovibrio TaxID=2627060 RepID=UPI0007AEA50D|nr:MULTISPECIES: UDP-N-acetylglucosamine 2-epimerase (non-hydrolyzing) [unclassified Pseudovibrio]KZL17221.1 UDP-N-acetylglucosamine 2-epimerase [Pseudovibrio sp. WM33]KZL22824.1 UDP-N-acetylglucosamine 2-epimerase [Pseudovibrio sp. Ad37]